VCLIEEAWSQTSHSLSFHPFLSPRTLLSVSDNGLMKDEIKLSIAFLALNAGVIALVVSGYVKGGMNFGSVISFILGS
jgi:hypothetical protein